MLRSGDPDNIPWHAPPIGRSGVFLAIRGPGWNFDRHAKLHRIRVEAARPDLSLNRSHSRWDTMGRFSQLWVSRFGRVNQVMSVPQARLREGFDDVEVFRS